MKQNRSWPSWLAGAPVGVLVGAALSACATDGATARHVRVEAAETATSPPATPLPFIENDYPRALGEARARGLPLFIDAWATWCHTCLSMRNYVFPSVELNRHSQKFVWLALDTERQENAGLVESLSIQVLPTLFVVDSTTERPLLAWRGSLTPSELAALLDDIEGSMQRKDARGEAAAALLRGLRASANGRSDEAIAEYRGALGMAPDDWPKRAQVVDSLVTELAQTHKNAECVTTGAVEAPRMPPGSALADVLRAAMGCAAELPKPAPEKALWGALVERAKAVASNLSQPILADDRSDLYDYVLEGLGELGRKQEAQQTARTWASMLEEEARRAPNPAARAVFDAHRLLAYLAVGEPERALPMLGLSERDFPTDYNPPARLAVAYRAMKRYDDALAAVGRALDRAYGPRKLRLWLLEADIYEDKADPASARRALREARQYAGSVPLTGGYAKMREAIATRLAKLSPGGW